jgi:hypothetical protein
MRLNRELTAQDPIRASVLDLLLGRFPGDCGLLAQMAAATLESADGAGGGVSDGTEPGALAGREAMVLGLLEQHQGFAEAAKGGSDDSGGIGGCSAAGVHGVLCGHAGRLFQARRYAAATRFYTAALDFADVGGSWFCGSFSAHS